jgi:predicted ferric reductase
MAWRDPIYIAASFAGAIALALLLFQPLLAAGSLPGLTKRRSKQVHRLIGALLCIAVLIHVAGLWITSPPDVVDAMLFRSPTAFSMWGVIAMWAVFVSGILAIMRKRLHLHPRIWRRTHLSLAVVIVLATVIHAMLIDGAMETLSKAVLCVLVIAAMSQVILNTKSFMKR